MSNNTNSASSAASSRHRLLYSSLLFLLLRFGVSYGLVNRKNGAGSLSGSLESVDLDQKRFPDE